MCARASSTAAASAHASRSDPSRPDGKLIKVEDDTSDSESDVHSSGPRHSYDDYDDYDDAVLGAQLTSPPRGASLWIDYVPSESNPADVPSRLHEMSPAERAAALAPLGEWMEMTVPSLADSHGRWLSSVDIASALWK